jgi:hypothetical protein
MSTHGGGEESEHEVLSAAEHSARIRENGLLASVGRIGELTFELLMVTSRFWTTSSHTELKVRSIETSIGGLSPPTAHASWSRRFTCFVEES